MPIDDDVEFSIGHVTNFDDYSPHDDEITTSFEESTACGEISQTAQNIYEYL